jgi:2-hydroxymuconate-semialdehyde hydrolase
MSNPEIGKTIKAAGRDTNYLEEGNGPPILLLHGSGPGVTGYANWRMTIPALSEDFRVIAPDAMGFGYTERLEGDVYTLDNWVAHTVGFMDALDIEKASFLGNSFGGALTIAIASRYPERVDRMALMGAAGLVFELTENLDKVWGYEPSPDYMREMMMECFAYDKSIIGDDLVRSRYEASVRPGYHESYSAMFPAPRWRHVRALSTPEDRIAALTNRTLLVHGREDLVIPLQSSIRYHHLIKHSELHVFGECGHWTQIEQKERFNTLVRNFFLS